MAKNQVSPKPAKAATTQPANEAPVLNVPLEDLRLALFEAESRIADYMKTAGSPQIATLARFAELARNFLAEHQSRDSEATLEYLARSLAEMWTEVKAITSQPALTPEVSIEELNAYPVNVNNESLERIERIVGEYLAARRPAPEPTQSKAIAESVNDVRMALVYNHFYTYNPPASLDETWPRNCLTALKRNLHKLSPFEVISLCMFVEMAAKAPMSDEVLSYVERRAEQSRQWLLQEKDRRERRAAKKAQRRAGK